MVALFMMLYDPKMNGYLCCNHYTLPC